MASSNCVFCRIASGEIPSLRVLDTPGALAFLDVGPLAPGHLLLIPKKHYTNLLDASPEAVASLCGLLPRLGAAVMRATGVDGLNVLHNAGKAAGQAVFHLHFHLIPRREGDRLGYRWEAGKYAADEAQTWQARLVAELASAG